MKKDVIGIFILGLISVSLIIFGIYFIGTMPAVSHRGTSNIPAMIFAGSLLIGSVIFTSQWIATIIHNANNPPQIINWDDEDAYEFFSREIAEMDAENS